MFRPVPDVDYVYCSDEDPPLVSTDFARYCQTTWEVVHTAATWGEFLDRLTAIDPGLVETMFPDGLSDFFEQREVTRETAFGGYEEIGDEWAGMQLSFSGGEDGPYRSWEDDMPEEIVELADWGTSRISGDFCYLEPSQLPAALEVIRARGETAVEDCKLVEELGWLFNRGVPEMPPGWEKPVP